MLIPTDISPLIVAEKVGRAKVLLMHRYIALKYDGLLNTNDIPVLLIKLLLF
jgi:hypothetical protein